MKKWVLSVTAAAAIIGLSACNNANNSSQSSVVVETKEGNITKSDFDKKLEEQYGESVLYEMVVSKVLEAKYPVTDKEVNTELTKLKEQYGAQFSSFISSYGAKDEESFKSTLRLKLIQDKALASYINVPEADIKKKYAEMKPEIKASHILIKDEKTANEVLQKVKSGEDFAELAKKYSEDPGSAANGGDLGYFSTGTMTKPFEEAAFALKAGEVSGLVKSEFGYHIIKLIDRKELKPYAQMKDEIRSQIVQEKASQDPTTVQAKIKQELKDANIKIKDENYKGIFEFINADEPNPQLDGKPKETSK